MTTDYDQNSQGYDTDHSRGFAEGEKHPARVVGCLWDKAQHGGLCLALKLRITDGPRVNEELRGRLYFDTERPDKQGRTALDRSMEALEAMGCTGDLESIVDGDGAGVLDGGDVEIVVGINQKGYPEAKFINRPNVGGVQLKAFDAPTDNDKRAFFAQMKARQGAMARGAQASGTARPAPVNTAQQPRPQPSTQTARQPTPQRPAPQATRGPGARANQPPVDDFGGAGDDSEIPF